MHSAFDEMEMLKPERLAYWCRRIGIPDEMATILETIRESILADGTLCEAIHAYHHRLIEGRDWGKDWTSPEQSPVANEKLGEDAWAMDFLAYLSALPFAEAWYREKGISKDLFDATMSDIGLWVHNDHVSGIADPGVFLRYLAFCAPAADPP